jgi:hypothetical protein
MLEIADEMLGICDEALRYDPLLAVLERQADEKARQRFECDRALMIKSLIKLKLLGQKKIGLLAQRDKDILFSFSHTGAFSIGGASTFQLFGVWVTMFDDEIRPPFVDWKEEGIIEKIQWKKRTLGTGPR